ncbi:MAG: GTP 3',8-cyclase MoaA, partial [Lysobacteraceae bacterium]
DGAGEIGFVSSISEPFCGDCQRARVSADGHLYTCLFSAAGADLRATIADGEQALANRVADLWSRRADRYSELRGQPAAGRGRHVEMFLVGG